MPACETAGEAAVGAVAVADEAPGVVDGMAEDSKVIRGTSDSWSDWDTAEAIRSSIEGVSALSCGVSTTTSPSCWPEGDDITPLLPMNRRAEAQKSTRSD